MTSLKPLDVISTIYAIPNNVFRDWFNKICKEVNYEVNNDEEMENIYQWLNFYEDIITLPSGAEVYYLIDVGKLSIEIEHFYKDKPSFDLEGIMYELECHIIAVIEDEKEIDD